MHEPSGRLPAISVPRMAAPAKKGLPVKTIPFRLCFWPDAGSGRLFGCCFCSFCGGFFFHNHFSGFHNDGVVTDSGLDGIGIHSAYALAVNKNILDFITVFHSKSDGTACAECDQEVAFTPSPVCTFTEKIWGRTFCFSSTVSEIGVSASYSAPSRLE